MIRKLPDAPFISFKFLDEEDGCSLRAHSHPELSVGLVTTSGTNVTVEGLDFSLESGDLILIPAEQIHLCRPENEETFRFYMIFMDVAWVEESTGIAAHHIRPTALPCPPGWKELFRLLEETPEDRDIPARLAEALKGLVESTGEETPAVGTDRPQTAGRPQSSDLPEGDLLEDVHRQIAESPQFTLRIDDMAALAGMSKYDFLRKYTRRYGITPHASVTDRRIRLSLEKMAEGLDLTRIAADCGFADQSHFNRQFRLYTGMKPSEYRKAILSN